MTGLPTNTFESMVYMFLPIHTCLHEAIINQFLGNGRFQLTIDDFRLTIADRPIVNEPGYEMQALWAETASPKGASTS